MKTMQLWTLILVAMLVACGSAAPPVEPGDESPEPPTATAPPSLETASPLPTPTSPSVSSPLSPLPEPTSAGSEATETGGRWAEFPNTIVVYHRDSQKWTIYVTGRVVGGDGSEWMVPADAVKPLLDSVEADAFWELEDVYGAAGDCPDCPVQKLTVYRGGEIKEITVNQQLDTLPMALGSALGAIDRVIVLQ